MTILKYDQGHTVASCLESPKDVIGLYIKYTIIIKKPKRRQGLINLTCSYIRASIPIYIASLLMQSVTQPLYSYSNFLQWWYELLFTPSVFNM